MHLSVYSGPLGSPVIGPCEVVPEFETLLEAFPSVHNSVLPSLVAFVPGISIQNLLQSVPSVIGGALEPVSS